MVNISAASYQPYTMVRNTENKSSQNSNAVSDGAIPYAAASQEVVPTVANASNGESQKSGRDGKRNQDNYQCETCSNRKYQDGSNDPGVSFKTPTALTPDEAASAVRSHENEHVNREQASAAREGRKVISQSVTYSSAICSECGTSYTSGGTTRTVTKNQLDKTYGMNPEAEEVKGKYLDKTA